MVVTKNMVRRRASSAAPSHLIHASSPVPQIKHKQSRRSKSKGPRQPSNSDLSLKKRNATLAAEQTVDLVLGDGKYIETRRCRDPSPLADSLGRHATETVWHVEHNITADIAVSVDRTSIYHMHTPLPAQQLAVRETRFEFTRSNALTIARRYAPSNIMCKATPIPSQVGVLVLTSSSPGGDFTEGSTTFDAVVARSTTIIASLSMSSAGQEFYHTFNPHSILYSPQVVGFRRDEDDTLELQEADFVPSRDAILADGLECALNDYVAPYVANVLSVPHAQWDFADASRSRQALKLRLSRVLDIFAARGDRILVLRPECNVPLETVAQVYAELLTGTPDDTGSGRFRNVFDKVVFCVGRHRLSAFRHAFDMRTFEDELNAYLSE
ncbi:hypothetical protein K488DRAFT_82424 [Vararia minispora EC-137]|uniref:Uncharacterized protein n=1 Tax=Vararia minispora EC-137 TaxID=1314806 RepID=A0ACB8QWB7_9AGAM|nr:hypothetical protein K488DRAFT_82424 [Vararia minispora EC-137]